MAVSADGSFVVTWENFSTDGNDIMARLFHADGTPAGDAFLVNTTTANGQFQPSVAMNGSGNFVIVWESVSDDGQRYDVFAQRYDSEGTAVGTEFRVHADVDARRQYADVAMDADGGFVVTWMQLDWDLNESQVFFRQFDSTGTPVAGEVQLDGSFLFLSSPDIAAAPDGGFVIAWVDSSAIWVQRFDADGNTVDDRFAVNDNSFADMPSIAVDGTGGFVVTWYGSVYGNSPGDLDIYARRFSADGIAVGSQFVVNQSTANRQWYPVVAAAADGNFVISWTSENPDFNNRDVFVRTFNSSGTPLGDEFQVNPVTTGDQRYGHVAITSAGEFIVNWTDSYNGELYARRYALNLAPTDVTLDSNFVAENSAVGTAVGTFLAVDADGDETFVFELVSGEGDDDNAEFQIVGNQLLTDAVFDFETKSSYTIRVRATDLAGGSVEKSLTIQVVNVIETPTVTLDNQSVDENQPPGTTVGVLGLTDAPEGAVSYRLVGGEGSSGNARFRIVGNQLQTRRVLDAELQSSYSVRVQATDAGGNVSIQVFTIEVNDVNDALTGVRFTPSDLAENAPAGTVAGHLEAIDADVDDSWTFELVAGRGDADNGLFTVNGNAIETAAPLDYETKAKYTIRVRATDSGGASVERVLTIRITNVNEAPTAIRLSNTSVGANRKAGQLVGRLTATDPDRRDRRTFSLVPGAADNDLFRLQGTSLRTSAVLPSSLLTVRIRVTDREGLWFEEEFTVTVG